MNKLIVGFEHRLGGKGVVTDLHVKLEAVNRNIALIWPNALMLTVGIQRCSPASRGTLPSGSNLDQLIKIVANDLKII